MLADLRTPPKNYLYGFGLGLKVYLDPSVPTFSQGQTDRDTDTCPPIHIQTGKNFKPILDTFYFTKFTKDKILILANSDLAPNPKAFGVFIFMTICGPNKLSSS
jgi:hypothetical protein